MPSAILRGFPDRYDVQSYESTIRSALSSLPPRHCIAFAACCAERMFPFYRDLAHEIHANDAKVLRSVIDRIWLRLLSGTMAQQEIEQLLKSCETLDFGPLENPYRNQAIHAANAAYHALKAYAETPLENSVEAAKDTINTIDQVIQARDDAPIDSILETHPLIVAELKKQASVIQFLGDHQALVDADVLSLQHRC
jgi:uncharacterized protein YjaG (DUF416 family)